MTLKDAIDEARYREDASETFSFRCPQATIDMIDELSQFVGANKSQVIRLIIEDAYKKILS